MSRSVDADTTRLTITLPTSLVRELDENLRDVGASREVAIRRLIEAALRDHETRERREKDRQAQVEQYVRGWREQPPTAEEFGWTTHPSTMGHLAEVPWASDEEQSGGPISQLPGDAAPSY